MFLSLQCQKTTTPKLKTKMATVKKVPAAPKAPKAPNALDLLKSKAVEKKSAKSATKDYVDIDSSTDMDTAKAQIELARLTALEKDIKSKKDVVYGQLKEVAITEYIKRCKKTGQHSESFMLRFIHKGVALAQMMFGVQNRFTSIKDKETGAQLAEKYPKYVGLVNTYSIDAELMEKYGHILAPAILEAIQHKDIADEDRENILKVTENYAVIKETKDNGTTVKAIERLAKEKNLEEVFSQINPISFIKDPKVIAKPEEIAVFEKDFAAFAQSEA